MGILIGTVTYPDLRRDESIVRSAAISIGEGTESKTTILNLQGCCMGRVSFARERGSEGGRVVTMGESGLMWTGYITDIDRIKQLLEDAGVVVYEGSSDAQILLESYFKFGVESLQELNGLYSIVIWDDTKRRFSAVTDRYGFTKIYYWLGPDGMMFASECKAIIQHPKYHKDIDKEGIVNFLGAGYCFGETTLFQGIKLIPQGCFMVYDGRGVSFKKYWDYSVKPVTGTIEGFTDKFYYNLQSAFERCVNGEKNVFIPISGGLDSRTIAGIAKNCGKSIFGCTVGLMKSRDVCYGKKIAKKFYVNHTVLPISSDYIAQYGPSGVKLAEGTVTNHVFFILRILDCNIIPNIMVSGFIGDVLTGKNLFAGMTNSEEMKKFRFLRAFNCPELNDILNSSFKSLIGINSDYWNKSLHSADAEAFADKLVILSLRERQRRYTTFLINHLGRELNVVAPFSDNQFVDFIMTIPPELRIEQKLYKNVILNKLPFVADIPRDKTGERIRSTWWSWRWEYLKGMVPHCIRQKYSGLRYRLADYPITQKIGIGYKRPCWCIDADDSIRSGSFSYFRELFSDREHMVDLFQIDAVDKLFKDHVERRIHAYDKLCAIATIIEWRRQFKL
jgi:asparagine synthetase B (glutamine-hydrolysing)